MTETDRPGGPLGRVAVIVPTYNERPNLEQIAARLRTAVPEADLLVVDDNSPDGTGEAAEKLAAGDARIHVLHRPGKSGLGSAYIAGFRWALERGYGVLVEIDADGSRYVTGGIVLNWPKSREVLSRGGNTYARVMLGIKVRDATGGYRAYRASALRRIALDEVESQGYCFQIELALRAIRAGLTVVEVPITFVERTRGASKMSRAVMVEALWRVTQWGIAARLHGRRPASRKLAS